jgi:hypothetical protein
MSYMCLSYFSSPFQAELLLYVPPAITYKNLCILRTDYFCMFHMVDTVCALPEVVSRPLHTSAALVRSQVRLWLKWHWGRFRFTPAKSYSSNCSILLIILSSTLYSLDTESVVE